MLEIYSETRPFSDLNTVVAASLLMMSLTVGQFKPLFHCSTATATEYPMLALQQDAVLLIIMEHEEKHRDNEPFHGMNFNFV